MNEIEEQDGRKAQIKATKRKSLNQIIISLNEPFLTCLKIALINGGYKYLPLYKIKVTRICRKERIKKFENTFEKIYIFGVCIYFPFFYVIKHSASMYKYKVI